MTLHEAAHDLYLHFGLDRYPGLHPVIQSIGVADNTGTIHVYLVREPMAHEKQVPSHWQSWPIESRVVGRIGLI